MTSFARVSFPIALLSALCACSQSSSSPSATKQLSPTALAHLLREPGGLAACAQLVGTCSYTHTPYPIVRPDLKALASLSSVIVLGTLSKKVSELSPDGDDIWTTWTVAPWRVFKGLVPAGGLKFEASGGFITFANGTSAEVITTEWARLQPDKPFLMFLRKHPDGVYTVMNGADGLVSASDAAHLESLASFEDGPHPVVDEVKGLSLATMSAKLKALLAESK